METERKRNGTEPFWKLFFDAYCIVIIAALMKYIAMYMAVSLLVLVHQ